MDEIKIIDAVPEDARGIVEVLHQTWLSTYPNEELGITKEDIDESYRDSYKAENILNQQKKIKELSKNKKKMVAKTGQKIIAAATMIRNEEFNELITLYVLPEYQGNGIGTRLWNEVSKICDPTKDIIVHVVTYNKQAIDFYKKCGFVDTGKRFTNEQIYKRRNITLPEMEMVIQGN